MQSPPAAGAEQVAAALAHPGERAARLRTRFGPGPTCRAEPRACPMDHLDGAALGRGVGQRARQRPQGLGVDPRKRRQLDDEPGRARVDVELARFVEGAPGQERMERGRHGGRRPGTRCLRALEQLEKTPDHGSVQPAGSSTTRTWLASR